MICCASPKGEKRSANELLIKINTDVSDERVTEILKENNLEFMEKIASLNIIKIKIKDSTNVDVEALIKKLQTYKEIKYAEPNYTVEAYK